MHLYTNTCFSGFYLSCYQRHWRTSLFLLHWEPVFPSGISFNITSRSYYTLLPTAKKKQWAGSGTGLSIHLSNQLHIWHTFHNTKPPLATDVLSFPQGFYLALSEVPVSKWPQAVYHTSMDETYLCPASPGNQEMSTLCVNLEYLQTPSTLLAGQLVMTARSPPFCNGCSWAGFNQYKKLSKLESTMKYCPLQPCPEQARGISMGQQHAGLFLAHVGRAYELKGLGRDHLWNTLIASALQRQAGHSSALRVLYHEKYLSGNWDKEPWP